jgi:RNA polymerase sigma factor (sigma-70 family)
MESSRIIAATARVVRDVGRAEEIAQDALLAALEQWPREGVPENAAAWLMTAARRRAIDAVRRERRFTEKQSEIARPHGNADAGIAEVDAALDDDIGDDVLRLIFTTCHPVLAPESRVTLTLRLLGGLTTAEIARAYLTSEATIAQRIVRAKRTLAEAGVPFEVPRGADRFERLGTVLGVIYLIFNEGYTATAGDDWLRPALCEEALRLVRVLEGLEPDEPEVHGLAALLEIQSSRNAARIGRDGEPILLLDQNRALWNRLSIGRGLAALDRALSSPEPPGPYTLQGAIAACHARALTAAATDWRAIEMLYTQLAVVAPSPVVELNRAVAVAMHRGPAAGLDVLDTLRDDPALAGYHLLPGVRGDLLFKLGRLAEAEAEFRAAAALTRNARERDLLLRRAEECTKN